MTAPKPRRRTIRLAIVAVVCVLLGAVTTVGVAWKVAFPDPWAMWDRYSREWPRAVPREWNWSETDLHSGSVYTYWMSGHGYQRCYSDLYHPGGELDPLIGMELRCYGWPCLALMSMRGRHETATASMTWEFISRQQGFSRRKPPLFLPGNVQWLPVMPLFPGFALDTALYAAAWYLLIFTPLPLIRAGRRRFRVSRGMCGSCGYDLNASPNRPCPECGAGAGARA